MWVKHFVDFKQPWKMSVVIVIVEQITLLPAKFHRKDLPEANLKILKLHLNLSIGEQHV